MHIANRVNTGQIHASTMDFTAQGRCNAKQVPPCGGL